MILNKTILILEDNLLVLSKFLEKLYLLEGDQPYELSVIILTNSHQVEDYINTNPKADFDIVLLDRDCKLGKSFHVLNIEKFGPEKVISISSVPEYNEDAKSRGAQKVILKDLSNIDGFTSNVIEALKELIRKLPD